MAQFFIDFTIVAVLVIGITALMGVILNGIGEKHIWWTEKTTTYSNE